MTTIRTRHAARAYPQREYTDRGAVRHLRRGYIRARLILGDRWVLAQRAGRKVHARRDAVVFGVTVALTLPLLAADLVARLV